MSEQNTKITTDKWFSDLVSDTDFYFGMKEVPNLWLKHVNLDTGELEPLTFWEYEDLVSTYCETRIAYYLDINKENSYGHNIRSKKRNTRSNKDSEDS